MGEGTLKDFIETASSVSPFRVEDDFGNGFVRLRSEEAERRQAAHDIRSTEDIVIEALRNARDAHARTILMAVSREGDRRRITVIDDGDGIPPEMHERIFESRVTSKLDSAHMDKWGVHGRGMALYSISVNCETARVASSDAGKGAALVFESDLRKLGEKADQSTFPSFEMSEAGTVTVRGPRNILRTSCEFAVDSTDSCTLYVGSPAEVAATLHAYATATLSAAQRAFCSDENDLPVCKRLAASADPADFARIAERLGLNLSERTARRIMDGQIPPLDPLVERIVIEEPKAASAPVKSRRKRASGDGRGLKIDDADLLEFSDAVRRAFSDLARDYYLDASVQPDIVVRKDRISVSIPVQKL